MADATTLSERGAPPARPARRRFGWAWLGLVPFFLFSIAFMFLPVAYLVIGSFVDGQGAAHGPKLRRPLHRSHPERVRQQHRDQRRHRHRGRHVRIPARLLRDPRRAAAVPADRPDDVLRGRLELRGCAAGPGVHLHPRHARIPDDTAEGLRDRHLRRRPSVQPDEQVRPRARLHVLPVPAHGPDHRPGPGRAEARVAGGRGECGRLTAASTGDTSPCRS